MFSRNRRIYSQPKINEETRKLLANEIHKYPPIWDPSNEHYMKRDVSNSYWNKVSQVVKMPVSVCKSTWKALRDALTYRTRAINKNGKSIDGSLADEDGEGISEMEIESQLQSWPLWESLRFLLDNKIKRTTTTSGLYVTPSPTPNDDEDGNAQLVILEQNGVVEKHVEEEDCDSKLCSTSTEVKITNCKRFKPSNSYDYHDYARSKRRKESTVTTCEVERNVTKSIPELMEIRNVEIPAPGLKYDSIYANLDRMFKKLPESVVEDLNVQFINLTYAKVKTYGNFADNVVIEIDQKFQ